MHLTDAGITVMWLLCTALTVWCAVTGRDPWWEKALYWVAALLSLVLFLAFSAAVLHLI